MDLNPWLTHTRIYKIFFVSKIRLKIWKRAKTDIFLNSIKHNFGFRGQIKTELNPHQIENSSSYQITRKLNKVFSLRTLCVENFLV